jgi:hypothetical protein
VGLDSDRRRRATENTPRGACSEVRLTEIGLVHAYGLEHVKYETAR